MTQKKYRLETVVTIRERAKDEAAKQVALRMARLAAAEEELARRQQNLRDCFDQQRVARTRLSDELDRGAAVGGVVAHQNFLNDLRRQEAELQSAVEDQKNNVARAEKELENAREALMNAAKELKAIETHKTNWKDTEKRESNRREEKFSDEIGSIIHGRREKSD